MTKKKILIVSDTLLPRLDGVSIFLANLIPKIKNRFDITLIAPKFENTSLGVSKHMAEKYFEGVNLVYTKLTPFFAGDYQIPYPSKKAIKKLVEENDLIFVQSLGPLGITAAHQAKKLKKPLFAYTHSVEFELWSKSIKSSFLKSLAETSARKMMFKVYDECDTLFVPSQEVKSLFEKEGFNKSLVIVPVGIDTKKFFPPKNKDLAKKEAGFSDRKTIIGYIGRIGREKDIETLILAFENLEKKYKNLLLVIVGTGLVEQLKKKIHSKNIIFTGSKEDVVPFYQAMDIFVLPSLTETSSLSTLEAMSCGLPVVVTPVGLLKNLIDKGENGFLFPKRSVDVLTETLDKLIEDDELQIAVGKKARETIRALFSWETTAQKISDVLEHS